MKNLNFPVTISEGGVSAKIRKIVQIKNGKAYTVFIVDYFLRGKRKQAGRAKFDEAKTIALNACRDVANGNQDLLTLSNSDRMTYLRATEFLIPLQIKLDVAAQRYVEASEILGGKASIAEACREWTKRNAIELPKITVPNAVERFLSQAVADGKSKIRLKDFSGALDRFAENFQCYVHTLTPKLISEYLTALKLSERTKHNHRAVLGYFSRWLVLNDYLSKGTNLLDGVQKYSARKLSEIEIYTPEEIRQLLRAAGTMTPFISTAAFAGLRHAEIARLDWHEVDLEDGFIEVSAAKSKTGERRLVPIPENLKKWLLPYRQPRGKVVPYVNTTKQLLKVAGAAGITWKHNALRHSFISYRVAECANVARVSDEAGNSPQMIHQHYLRRVKPALAAEWFSIVP
jgi:integrase